MRKTSDKWHRRYLDLAALVATWSKHPDFKVGAVAIGEFGQVLSTGFNGYPRGVQEEVTRRSEGLLPLTIHAETNLIFNCTLTGQSLRGSTVYVSGLFPCLECSKSLVQVCVAEIVYYKSALLRPDSEAWKDSWDFANLVFDEANVRVTPIEEETARA